MKLTKLPYIVGCSDSFYDALLVSERIFNVLKKECYNDIVMEKKDVVLPKT